MALFGGSFLLSLEGFDRRLGRYLTEEEIEAKERRGEAILKVLKESCEISQTKSKRNTPRFVDNKKITPRFKD